MTGNTKVWRAPLAGLASVAMIATMDVAASTANAQNNTSNTWQYPYVDVTLDYNGGTNSAGAKTETTHDANAHNAPAGYQYADGVFEGGANPYAKAVGAKWDGSDARLFSGWYTEKQGGEAVAPDTVLKDGQTLYAHWSQGAKDTDESEDVVHVDFEGGKVAYKGDVDYGSGVVDEAKGEIRLAEGDTLAAWQLPTDGAADGIYPTWDNLSSVKAGQTVSPTLASGTKVTIKGSPFTIYKDGEPQGSAPAAFDVAQGSNLAGYQAVDASTKRVAASWTVDTGDAVNANKDYHVNEALPVASEANVTPNGPGVESTVVRVHKWEKATTDLWYFVANGQSFTTSVGEALADVTRGNVSFLGWYDSEATVTVKGTDKATAPTLSGTFANKDFFSNELLLGGDAASAALVKLADPVKFSFDKLLSATPAGIDLYAGYTADAKYTTITLDPNYSGADKIEVKIYQGKKIGDQLPTVTRDGYILDGWYSEPVNGWKLDTTVVANDTFPRKGLYYAHWKATSKYGVNGLLSYLSFGYATGLVDKDGNAIPNTNTSDYGYPTFSSTPAKPIQLSKESKKTDGVYQYKHDAAGEFVEQVPAGYNEASYKQLQETRKNVVKELIAELQLPKNSNIDAVYEAVANRLSAERADAYNQEFAGKLVANTDYPDVNYDDYGTHHHEVTYLTDKGIV